MLTLSDLSLYSVLDHNVGNRGAHRVYAAMCPDNLTENSSLSHGRIDQRFLVP